MTLTPATRVMINQFLRECKHRYKYSVRLPAGRPYCSSDEFSPDNSKSRTCQQGEKSSPNLLVWSLRAPTQRLRHNRGSGLETGGFDQEELGETELAATTFSFCGRLTWLARYAPFALVGDFSS
jgi:hypothetical protein